MWIKQSKVNEWIRKTDRLAELESLLQDIHHEIVINNVSYITKKRIEIVLGLKSCDYCGHIQYGERRGR